MKITLSIAALEHLVDGLQSYSVPSVFICPLLVRGKEFEHHAPHSSIVILLSDLVYNVIDFAVVWSNAGLLLLFVVVLLLLLLVLFLLVSLLSRGVVLSTSGRHPAHRICRSHKQRTTGEVTENKKKTRKQSTGKAKCWAFRAKPRCEHRRASPLAQ